MPAIVARLYAELLSIKLQYCEERLLWHLYITDLLHAFLTLLLFLEQLAFT